MVIHKKCKDLIKFLFLSLLFLTGCSSPDEGPSYKVALDPSWYPQDFMGKEAAVGGFSGGVIRAIGEKEGFNVQLMTAGPAFLEWGLNEGNYDAILTSLSPAINYEGRYHFSEPYLLIGPVVIVPINSPYKDLADLAGKTVAIQRGSSAVTLLGSTVPNIVILAYDFPARALEVLLSGRFDAVVMPALTAGSYVSDLYHDRLKIISAPLTQEGLRLVTLDEAEDLVGEFNAGLQKIKSNGTYQDLVDQWRVYAK